MVAPFEEAAFELGENEVSEIVTSDFGYHIIKRVPLDVDKETIEAAQATLIQEFQVAKYTEYLAQEKKLVEVVKDEKKLNSKDINDMFK